MAFESGEPRNMRRFGNVVVDLSQIRAVVIGPVETTIEFYDESTVNIDKESAQKLLDHFGGTIS